MCSSQTPGSSSTFGQEAQNFKLEPGLLSHYEDLFVRLGGQSGFYSTVCDCDPSLKYLDIGIAGSPFYSCSGPYKC